MLLVGGCKFEEASHTPLPQVLDENAGPVLTAPHFYPITFADDVYRGELDDFVSRIGTSEYWRATTSEYGVGPASATPIHLDEASPLFTTFVETESWLASRLQSGSLPAGDEDALYVLFYTDATTPTDGLLCGSANGYHDFIAPGAAYAVIARCDAHDQPLDRITAITTHELVEAATDPQIGYDPAYFAVGSDDGAWALQSGTGSEVGDLCQSYATSFAFDAELHAEVQRTWSNAAAKAGHEPCVPAYGSGPYFNAAPELDHSITAYDASYEPIVTDGIEVRWASTRTVPVHVFSDRATTPITVSASFGYTTGTIEASALHATFDRNTAVNGDVLRLTLRADERPRTTVYGSYTMVITAQVGDVVHQWPIVLVVD